MTGKNATETLPADAAGIARAAAILESGGLVALPTETVYGLAARADSAQAVAKIYAAKGRPSFNPLIVHVADRAAAERLVLFDNRACLLAGRFWPGPLTLVLPLRADAGLAGAVTAGLATLAVRMPDHPVMRALLHMVGAPLAAPSANASETVSPTSAAHVLKTLDGRIDAVLDGGEARRGVESTILALRQDGTWSLLRQGPIAEAEVAEFLGSEAVAAAASIEAPGQLARHYAPGKPLRLGALQAEEGEFLLGFGAVTGDWSLSPDGDLAEAAARLYAGLHRAAEADQPRIAVAPIPEDGIGRAINDRLRRAAA
jgi:L-threonylcarbamoyladenylate synthase